MQYHGKALWSCGNSIARHHRDLPPGSCMYLAPGKAVQLGLALPRDVNEPPWEAAALVGILVFMKLLVFAALYFRTSVERS